jgi:hypothetical protein
MGLALCSTPQCGGLYDTLQWLYEKTATLQEETGFADVLERTSYKFQ